MTHGQCPPQTGEITLYRGPFDGLSINWVYRVDNAPVPIVPLARSTCWLCGSPRAYIFTRMLRVVMHPDFVLTSDVLVDGVYLYKLDPLRRGTAICITP